MEPLVHNINALFQQLGLPDSDADIERFIAVHSPLDRSTTLQNADFWNSAQASFLQEALDDDADWAEIVDELDARLHNQATQRAIPGKAWLSKSCSSYLPEMCGY
ncbi:MAG TPA: DUF2789 domain-containing protein [Spongiibacteraceae bacterium]|nr:hypothetical protein [Spongiibacteraceae bacterium]MBN51846.1 hypothetical protein [Spongiibacteraceae bacterium]HCS26394.1 DUF2789 domain-containing protein [Spongiibacteraceae bacterium]|tara:strand:+ start:519 stop:833 length:315 start_codon:yes stop_codon:yes gene_type:complete